MKVDIGGLQDLAKEFEREMQDSEKEFRKAIVLTAYKVHETAVKDIKQGVKTGYTYDWRGVSANMKPDSFRKVKGRVIPVKMRNKPHTASARGEAPASDTGLLANLITPKELTGLKAEVVSGAGYSGYLESTTDLNRPFLFPAVEKSMDFLDNEISKALMRIMTNGKV